MLTLEEVGHNLAGVWLLVKGDPEGLRWLDLSLSGIGRSFLAIIWCLPAFAVFWMAIRTDFLARMPEGTVAGFGFLMRLAAIDLASWILPLVVIALIARILGFGPVLGAIIAGTNWLSVPSLYIQAVPSAMILLMPGSQGLAVSLGLFSLVALTIALYRLIWTITERQTLLSTAITGILLFLPFVAADTLRGLLAVVPV